MWELVASGRGLWAHRADAGAVRRPWRGPNRHPRRVLQRARGPIRHRCWVFRPARRPRERDPRTRAL